MSTETYEQLTLLDLDLVDWGEEDEDDEEDEPDGFVCRALTDCE